MDLMDLGDLGSSCEENDCGFSEDCSNQEVYAEEPMFGHIELVCVTLVYIPLMLVGLMGNLLTILVVWLRPHMRSSTYLYLSSMAVSDLLILLLLPLDLYKLWRPRPWRLGDLACKLTMFLSECCTFCTVLHITFLSLERYVAVCWPIAAKTLVTRRRTRRVIGCLWLAAAVSAAPVLLMVGVEDFGVEERGWTGGREAEQGGAMVGEGGYVESLEGVQWREQFGSREEGEVRVGGEREEEADNETRGKKKEDEGGGRCVNGSRGVGMDLRECRWTDYAVSSGLLSAMMMLSNLYFLVPLFVLGLVYSLIGRTLCLRPQSSRRNQSHRHTVKMLGVIVLAFVLCWLPFHVGRTILSVSMGSGAADDLEAHGDSHLHADADVTAEARSHSNFSSSSSSSSSQTSHRTGKVRTTAEDIHTNKEDICAKDKVDTYAGDAAGPQQHSSSPDASSHSHNAPIGRTAKGEKHHPSSITVAPSAVTFDLNVTRFNSTLWRPDTHSYFLYYLSQYFNLVSSVLFYLSAAVNPLLYNLMSSRYRRAVHSLVHGGRSPARDRRLCTLATRQSSTTL